MDDTDEKWGQNGAVYEANKKKEARREMDDTYSRCQGGTDRLCLPSRRLIC